YQSKLVSADAESKNIHMTASGVISELETKNMVLPAGVFVFGAGNDGWICLSAGEDSDNIDVLVERMNCDIPGLSGIVTVCFGIAGKSRGGIEAVTWNPDSKAKKVAEWIYGNDGERGEWNLGKDSRNNKNIYGTYPELPTSVN
ncbi:MAG: hypothetical protein FWF82_06915, partial [Oscillospiraceae bacterium]|nr:hypothetical protein [Oscillospiraceae bacterium]